MKVYRLSKTKFAEDLTGEGARLNGGRWNHILTACLYTAESRALAVLEYTVNVNIDDIPRALAKGCRKSGDEGPIDHHSRGMEYNYQSFAPQVSRNVKSSISEILCMMFESS